MTTQKKSSSDSDPLNDSEQLLKEIWGEHLYSKIKEALRPPISDEKGSETPSAPKEEIKLSDFIGQNAAKAALAQVIALTKINQERVRRGFSAVEVTLHALFAGSPGTGKTTFARFYAQELKKLGPLKTGQLIEVSRSDLVAEYVGQTASKTTAVVKKAMGGILFIDEAYALKNSNEDHFGQECIDTLVKLMEDYRNDFVLILAGYTEEMRNFLHLNPGLKGRIPHLISFDDYSDEELGHIFDLMLSKLKLSVAKENRHYCMRLLRQGRKGRFFGNGRAVRNLIEKALAQQALRLSTANLTELSQAQLLELVYSDFTPDPADDQKLPPLEKQHSSLEKLQQLHGITEVKRELRKLSDFLKLQKLKHSASTGPSHELNLHMVFCGNPGTGKNSVAHILGDYFFESELLSSGHVITADRSSLVAAYLGQTSLKTKEKIKEALGGILFISDAHSLLGDTYATEALDTISSAMSEYGNNLAIILSGPTIPMQALLKSHKHLQGKISSTLDFRDLDSGELLSLCRKLAHKSGYHLSEAAEKKFSTIIEELRQNSHSHPFQNALAVASVLQNAFKSQAERLFKECASPSALDLQKSLLLEADDF
ncbi:MAG: AAA family ATPase [Oligoflexia bacterium]|nr:AAA family ATPase [Oligoflexia bacterium]